MTSAQLFETAMLLLFSMGWLASIVSMLWTRTPVRKSLLFVGLIWAGYVMGVCAKVAAWRITGALSPVIWFYIWNGVMIMLDLGLVLALTRPRPPAELRVSGSTAPGATPLPRPHPN
jgi:hypothetical protein